MARKKRRPVKTKSKFAPTAESAAAEPTDKGQKLKKKKEAKVVTQVKVTPSADEEKKKKEEKKEAEKAKDDTSKDEARASKQAEKEAKAAKKEEEKRLKAEEKERKKAEKEAQKQREKEEKERKKAEKLAMKKQASMESLVAEEDEVVFMPEWDFINMDGLDDADVEEVPSPRFEPAFEEFEVTKENVHTVLTKLRKQVAELLQSEADLQAQAVDLAAKLDRVKLHNLMVASTDTSASMQRSASSRNVHHGDTASLEADSTPSESSGDNVGANTVFRAGWVYKEGALNKSFKRRFFVMYGSRIDYYVNPRDSPKGSIVFDNTVTVSPAELRQGMSTECLEIGKFYFLLSFVFCCYLCRSGMWFFLLHFRLSALFCCIIFIFIIL